MKKKNKSQEYTLDNHTSLDKLLGPISHILSSIIISCAVLFAAVTVNNNSLKKDDLAKILSNINTNAGTVAGTTDNTQQQEQAVQVTEDQIKGLFVQGNVTFGDASKKVLFVEVADPSCPYCHVGAGKNPELSSQMGSQFIMKEQGGTYEAPVPAMKKLVDEGKASYVWIYRNGHGNGEAAAQALYCANEKGKFWEAHDLLMTNKGYNLINDQVKNDLTKAPLLAEFLKDVIEPAFITECVKSGKYATKLQEDQQLSTTLGVTGTPGYFINTTKFAGAYSYVDMKSAVDQALGN